jgi:hypothetical protein
MQNSRRSDHTLSHLHHLKGSYKEVPHAGAYRDFLGNGFQVMQVMHFTSEKSASHVMQKCGNMNFMLTGTENQKILKSWIGETS